MNVHNLMEEYVAERVEETYNQLNKRRPEWLKCDCESCRLDVTSYVLNKVHPHYIVSGRGAVYTAQTLIDKQLSADVDALVLDGIRRVATNLRPDHKVIAVQTILGDKEAESPAFNFPVITGTVLNGATFEPLANACVELKDGSGLVAMQDSSWANPAATFKSTNGVFSFWPKSITAGKGNICKRFHFTITASANGFASTTLGIDIDIASDVAKKKQFGSTLTYKVPDLILFNS
ncbi:MAG: late competence development ComFB family protein [Treponema sp.]|nr:late competence development ComFB family protein [Treponema sp.]